MTGPFTAAFTFTEVVSGFELADITVTNGAASALETSDDTVFTALITPETVGALSVSVAAGAAKDGAGNDSAAGGASLEVVAETPAVDLAISSATADPGDVAATATVSNPGAERLAFTAFTDAPWIEVDPTSGTIPSLGELMLTVTLNDQVDDLEPGDQRGTVTVTIDGGVGAPASDLSPQSTVSSVLVEIPITLAVEERFGTVELVAITPSGASGDESFTCASDIEAFDGLTLTTSRARAMCCSGRMMSPSACRRAGGRKRSPVPAISTAARAWMWRPASSLSMWIRARRWSVRLRMCAMRTRCASRPGARSATS